MLITPNKLPWFKHSFMGFTKPLPLELARISLYSCSRIEFLMLQYVQPIKKTLAFYALMLVFKDGTRLRHVNN